MARKNRHANILPQQKTPLVPHATVDRLNYWQFRVTVTDPAVRYPGREIYEGVHIGRDRANNVAKRKLNTYLRKQSYKNEAVTTYRAKGGAY